MKNKREVIAKLTKSKLVNYKTLAKYFAKKYIKDVMQKS